MMLKVVSLFLSLLMAVAFGDGSDNSVSNSVIVNDDGSSGSSGNSGGQRGNKNKNIYGRCGNEVNPVSVSIIADINITFDKEGAEYDPYNNLYWVTDRTNYKIHAIDRETLEFTGLTIESDDISDPFALKIYGNIMYVANPGNSKILGFDLSDIYGSNAFEQRVTYYTEGHYPNGLCVDESQDLLCFTDLGAIYTGPTTTEGVYCIKLATWEVYQVLGSGTGMYPNGCYINSNKNLLYTAGVGNVIWFIDSQLIVCDLHNLEANSNGENTNLCELNQQWEDYRTEQNDPRLGLANGITFDSRGVGYFATMYVDPELILTNVDAFLGLLTAMYIEPGSGGKTFCNFTKLDDSVVSPGDLSYDYDRNLILYPEISQNLKLFQIDRNF